MPARPLTQKNLAEIVEKSLVFLVKLNLEPLTTPVSLVMLL